MIYDFAYLYSRMQTRRHTDEELEALVKTQPGEGYEALYAAYSGRLYGLLMHLLQDERAAGEILEQVFAESCADLESYTGPLKLGTRMMNRARELAASRAGSLGKGFVHNGGLPGVFELVYKHCTTLEKAAEHHGIGLEEAVRQIRQELQTFKQTQA